MYLGHRRLYDGPAERTPLRLRWVRNKKQAQIAEHFDGFQRCRPIFDMPADKSSRGRQQRVQRINVAVGAEHRIHQESPTPSPLALDPDTQRGLGAQVAPAGVVIEPDRTLDRLQHLVVGDRILGDLYRILRNLLRLSPEKLDIAGVGHTRVMIQYLTTAPMRRSASVDGRTKCDLPRGSFLPASVNLFPTRMSSIKNKRISISTAPMLGWFNWLNRLKIS